MIVVALYARHRDAAHKEPLSSLLYYSNDPGLYGEYDTHSSDKLRKRIGSRIATTFQVALVSGVYT